MKKNIKIIFIGFGILLLLFVVFVIKNLSNSENEKNKKKEIKKDEILEKKIAEFPENIYGNFAIVDENKFSSSEVKIISLNFKDKKFLEEVSSLTYKTNLDEKFGLIADHNLNGNIFVFEENKDLKIIKNGELKILRTDLESEIASVLLSPKGNRILEIIRKGSGEYVDIVDTTNFNRFKTKLSNVFDFKFNNGDLELGALQSCDLNRNTSGLFISQKSDYSAFPREPLKNYATGECPEILYFDKLELKEEIVFVWKNPEESMETDSKSSSKIFFVDQYGKNLKVLEGDYKNPEYPKFISNGTEVLFFGETLDGVQSIFKYNILKSELKKISEFDDKIGEKIFVESFVSTGGIDFLSFQAEIGGKIFIYLVNSDGEFLKISTDEILKNYEDKKVVFLGFSLSPLGLSYKKFYVDSINPGLVVLNDAKVVGRIERDEKEQNFEFKIFDSKLKLLSKSSLKVPKGKNMEFFNYEINLQIPEVDPDEEMQIVVENEKNEILGKFAIKSFSKKIQILDEESLKSIIGNSQIIINHQEVDLNNDGYLEHIVLSEDKIGFGGSRAFLINIIAYNFSTEEWVVKYEFKNNSLQTIVGPESQKYIFPYIISNNEGEKAIFYGVEFEKEYKRVMEKYLTYWILDYDGKNVNLLLSETDLLRGEADFLNSSLITTEYKYKFKYDQNGDIINMMDSEGFPTLMIEKVFDFSKDLAKYELVKTTEIDLDPNIKR